VYSNLYKLGFAKISERSAYIFQGRNFINIDLQETASRIKQTVSFATTDIPYGQALVLPYQLSQYRVVDHHKESAINKK
jgi:hypothetical protein